LRKGLNSAKSKAFYKIILSETRIFCTTRDTHGNISSYTLLTAELIQKIVSQFTCEVGAR